MENIFPGQNGQLRFTLERTYLASACIVPADICCNTEHTDLGALKVVGSQQ